MNWQQLSHASREEIEAIQNKKLRQFVAHVLPFSPFYRALFEKRGLSFNDIQTTDDLVKLPFISKEDIAPTVEDRARPRQFILQPDEHLIKQYARKSTLIKLLLGKLTGQNVKAKLEWEFRPVHVHFTTGRSALPTTFVNTNYDLELLKESGRRLLDVIRVPNDVTAINGFPYSPHLAFWLGYYAPVAVNMTSLATGGGKIMGTQKILDALERTKAALAMFIPGYCYHILRQAVADGRDLSSLKTLVFGGERVSDGLRQRVQELTTKLGATDVKILATYAMTECKTAWIQCSEHTGYHLYPDLGYVELVNKEGKRAKDGEPGEVVYSTLDWRGSVVMRYRTGDLAKGIEWGSCPGCGKTVPRIFPDIQRKSEVKEFNLAKLKGVLVNLNNVYPLLSARRDIEEWQLEIRKRNDDPYEVDELRLHVAPKSGVKLAAIRDELDRAIRDELEVSVDLIETPLPKLLEQLGMETELKEKRIVDLRPKT
ncbi:MAG: AMP-binding protein [Candidatus Kerfeldbacteria bacterium]|nr:AMP-binding protein [Candidatus Kerfeldbacteria bacterium]